MSSGRDAFGGLPPTTYKVAVAKCSHGESCLRPGCGAPSVVAYRYDGDNGGPTPIPRYEGRCERHRHDQEYLDWSGRVEVSLDSVPEECREITLTVW